jgi:hypothetical protein
MAYVLNYENDNHNSTENNIQLLGWKTLLNKMKYRLHYHRINCIRQSKRNLLSIITIKSYDVHGSFNLHEELNILVNSVTDVV